MSRGVAAPIRVLLVDDSDATRAGIGRILETSCGAEVVGRAVDGEQALRGGGWLLLGHSESLLNVTADFEIVHLTRDLVYRKPLRAEVAP